MPIVWTALIAAGGVIVGALVSALIALLGAALSDRRSAERERLRSESERRRGSDEALLKRRDEAYIELVALALRLRSSMQPVQDFVQPDDALIDEINSLEPRLQLSAPAAICRCAVQYADACSVFGLIFEQSGPPIVRTPRGWLSLPTGATEDDAYAATETAFSRLVSAIRADLGLDMDSLPEG